MNFEEIAGIQHGSGIKTVIYGQEGVGKSTLASAFPSPVFIDCEGSTSQMDVRRLPKPTSWQMLCQEMAYVLESHKEKGYKTVIIDTFDWAERLALRELCAEHKVTGIEGIGYGKGWQYEAEKIGLFLDATDKLISAGINVVLLCHAISRKTTIPEEMEEFDHWELKLGSKTTNKIAPLLKEWSDITLFLAFKTNVMTADNGKTHKATSCQRVMYTTKTAWWDAKNRFGLPDTLPLSWNSISHIYGTTIEKIIEKAKANDIPVVHETLSPSSDEWEDIVPDEYQRVTGIPDALADLMEKNKVTAAEIEKVCSEIKGYMPKGMSLQNYPDDFVQGCLIGAWEQVYAEVKKIHIPF